MSIKSYQEQYAEILKKLLDSPLKKVENRNGKTMSRFAETMRVDLSKEFPLMEVKHVSIKNIIHELLWMIDGNTNIKYLVDNKCNIWNDDAYNYFKKKTNFKTISKDAFLKEVHNKNTLTINNFEKYIFGDLDRVYGFQWRKFNGETDQLQNAINKLKSDPNNRRILVTAHNPNDIEKETVGLPSCHNLFQFYTIPTEKSYKVCTAVNMRSNDFFLGQPYNMVQYALLTHMIAQICGYEVGELFFTLVDCHLYEEHITQANEWVDRYKTYVEEKNSDTYCKSEIKIDKKDNINDYIYNDFTLSSYNSMGSIKAPLLT